MFKKLSLKLALFVTMFSVCLSMAFAWGSWGHQHINYAAIFGLPVEMRTFFYNHKDFITEESVVPDLRKYTINDKAEFNRHFIDIEGFKGVAFKDLPQTMKDATAKYDAKFLDKMGILPWYIQDMMEKLTKAMKDKRKSEILFIAGDLGHYLGDANMPLHTSLNHDGQLTNQKGIHSFWESQLPDYFGNTYNFQVSQAVYIPNVINGTWDIIRHTHSLVDSTLSIEKNLSQTFDKKLIYKTDANGVVLKNRFGQQTRSKEFAAAYHKALNGMVERQMKHAIQDLSNFWYTAWVNAGKPNLTALDPAALTERNKKWLKKDTKLIEKGKVFGFRIETEFEK